MCDSHEPKQQTERVTPIITAAECRHVSTKRVPSHGDCVYNIQIYTRSLIGLSARVCTCVRDLNSNGARAGPDSSPRASAPATTPQNYPRPNMATTMTIARRPDIPENPHQEKGSSTKRKPAPKIRLPYTKYESRNNPTAEKVTTHASRSKPAETTPAPDPEDSCIALRTRSRLPPTKTPALPTPPVAAHIDTGLRRSKGKTPKTSKAPQSAPPSEPSTSMAAQYNTTDLENSESENPPLVDPRYSGLHKETKPPTKGSTKTDEEPEPFIAGIQAEGQNLTPKSSPTHTPDIILTSAPTTDELATTKDANNTTEVVETGLSKDDLLKATTEIDISQRIIKRRAYEAKDIIDKKNLKLTTIIKRSYLSDGTAVDEETKEYLNNIDPYNKIHNNDRTLSKRIEKLIRETQTKMSQKQNNSTTSIETKSNLPQKGRNSHPGRKQPTNR
ncbi:unnamed protein product [Trichogramma brassicae]|uniref:Uncharacterized protein n=1 Tax=Trichogramma brassicae TaxID=86971 RepID=A0A6H5I3B5_9HYME|nr:unnamed protein product [Trichogramma brassicae]